MGRPLSDKFFGNPDRPNRQFDEIDVWIPGEGAPEKATVIKQKNNYSFIVQGKTSSAIGRCYLVDKAPGSLAEGEMVMFATPVSDLSSPERVRLIKQNRLQTFEGNLYVWNSDVRATGAAECLLNEALGRPFVLEITVGAGSSFQLPTIERHATATQEQSYFLQESTYEMYVDWGDGEVDFINQWDQAETSHTYASADTYEISIYGRCDALVFFGNPNRTQVTGLQQWGDVRFKSMDVMFFQCSNLTYNATDKPDLSDTTTLRAMFDLVTTSQTIDVSGWDLSNVVVLTQLVARSNIDLLGLETWDVSNVTHFNAMFFLGGGGPAVDVSTWDVSNAKDMTLMFYGSDVENVDTSKWKINPKAALGGMFGQQTSYTTPPDVSEWGDRALDEIPGFAFVGLDRMFEGATYPIDVSNWDVSKVKELDRMFLNSDTSVDVSKWNTRSVTNFNGVFQGATADPDVSNWDTTRGKTFDNMFRDNTNANPDFSNWDFRSLESMDGFCVGATSFSSSTVDTLVQKLYEQRLRNDWPTPTLDLTDTAGPTGVYQDANPPTTGLEYIFKLENDPDSEGFNTWTFTY